MLVEFLQNPKTGATVSAATTGSGIGTILDLIPDDVGKLATLIGIALSTTIIYVHIVRIRMEKAKERRDIERDQIELSILKEKEAERLDRAKQRAAQGEPIRRCDD